MSIQFVKQILSIPAQAHFTTLILCQLQQSDYSTDWISYD